MIHSIYNYKSMCIHIWFPDTDKTAEEETYNGPNQNRSIRSMMEYWDRTKYAIESGVANSIGKLPTHIAYKVTTQTGSKFTAGRFELRESNDINRVKLMLQKQINQHLKFLANLWG